MRGGHLVVPGLVDSHIHPVDIIDVDQCDLDSVGKSLRQLAGFVQACVKRFHLEPGKWLAVHQWSSTNDNRPDAEYPTLRAALDRGAPANPVYLMGDDGHRAAFNSAGAGAGAQCRRPGHRHKQGDTGRRVCASIAC